MYTCCFPQCGRAAIVGINTNRDSPVRIIERVCADHWTIITDCPDSELTDRLKELAKNKAKHSTAGR